MGRWVRSVLAYSLIPLGLAALAFLVTPGVHADDSGVFRARAVADARALGAGLLGLCGVHLFHLIRGAYAQNAKRASGPRPVKKFAVRIMATLAFSLVIALVFSPFLFYEPRSSIRWGRECEQRMKLITLALWNYREDHGADLPACVRDEAGVPLHSWRVLILPYLGEDALYRQYRLSEPWNSPHNSKLSSKVPAVFQCPLAQDRSASLLAQWLAPGTPNHGATYLMLVGDSSAEGIDVSRATEPAAESSPDALRFVECPGINRNWLEPRDLSIQEFCDLASTSLDFHSHHFYAGLTDGRIERIPAQITREERQIRSTLADKQGD